MTMNKLIKFENIDILKSLKAIMRQNTEAYREDFNADMQYIGAMSHSNLPTDRILLWMSRPTGTWCFLEENVFVKDTNANRTWLYYVDQGDKNILVYTVEIVRREGRKIFGNLYVQDYWKHCENVEQNAQEAATNSPILEEDTAVCPWEYSCRYNVNDKEAMKYVMLEEKKKREKAVLGDFDQYIEQLRTKRIEAEAKRIVKELGKPTDSDETIYVRLSTRFLNLTTKGDLKRLVEMLPYKNVTFVKE